MVQGDLRLQIFQWCKQTLVKGVKLGQTGGWSGPLAEVGVTLHSACLQVRLCMPVCPAPGIPTRPEGRGLPRMNGPALLALFPEIPLPRAFALADVSPTPLSDALRFILSSRQDRKEQVSEFPYANPDSKSLTWGCATQLPLLLPLPPLPLPREPKIPDDKEPAFFTWY